VNSDQDLDGQRPFLLKRAVIASIAFFAISFLTFGGWVHFYFAGNYSGPLLISNMFGVSEKSASAGAKPVYDYPVAGWDGQFYYTQSNDPLILDDNYFSRPAPHTQHAYIDNISYRFQRNFLPLLAFGASRVTGHEATTPLVYFVTQFLIVSLGFGVLFYALESAGSSGWWACLWGLYGGVLRPLSHGLPDPTADALLLIAIVAVAKNRIVVYWIAASALCLCRESYAAPAAFVWMLTVLGKLDWNQKYAWLGRVALTTAPGAIVLFWAFYVAYRTNIEFLGGSRMLPWGALVDWPYKAYLSCLIDDLRSGNENEVLQSTSCMIVITGVLLCVVRESKKRVAAIALLPHILLMTMTGSVIWEAGVGFFKNAGSIILLGTLLSSRHDYKWLRWILIPCLLLSIQDVYRHDWRHQAFLPPIDSTSPSDSVQPSAQVPTEKIEYASKIEVVSVERPLSDGYTGVFSLFHRDPAVVTVRVWNTSNQTWPASLPGQNVICLGVRIGNGNKLLHEMRVPLYKEVPPDANISLDFLVPVGAEWLTGKTQISCGLVHESVAWFSESDSSQAVEIEL